MAAGSFLTLGHAHEVARRLHVQLLAFVVTDHGGLFTACRAGGCVAGDDLGDARQVFRQRFAARMRPAFPRCASQAFAPRLGFHLIARRGGFLFGQQLQLQIAQCLALRTQLLDPLPAQALFQHLDFQLRPVQLPLQFGDARGSVHSGEAL